MITNFFKIAFRHIKQQKLFSSLNVLGLSIAFACAILIVIYVQYELSYDNYHKNAENIYRVVQRQIGNTWRGTDLWNATTGKLKTELIEHFPEVEKAVIVNHYNARIYHNGKHFDEKKYFVSEPDFLEIFSFPLLKGNPATALSQPKSVLLTESSVEKYFGDEDPMGKTLLVNDIEHTVTGVLKDIPKNSHFTFDFLASFLNLEATEWDQNQGGIINWNSNNYSTYILSKDGTNPELLEKKITDHIIELGVKGTNHLYLLQNVTDIHLHSHANREFEANGDIRYIYIFSAIAVLLLLLASFNFMNLSTAQNFFFAKEVGVRKVSGANSTQVSLQFIGEALLISLFAFLLALIFTFIIIPAFSKFIGYELTISNLFNPYLLIGIVVGIIIIGLISGSYPALALSQTKPSTVLKEKKLGKSDKFSLRNMLIISQFAISIIMIISTIVLYKQLRFIQNRELGFEKENIINISINNHQTRRNYSILKEELLKIAHVNDVTCTNTTLDFNMWGGGAADWEGKQEGEFINFYQLYVDYNFLDFYNIQLDEGRNFSENISTDKRNAVILNNKAIEKIGWENAIGKRFRRGNQNGSVIGVTKDFNFQSLHLGIEPLIINIANHDGYMQYVSVKINPGNTWKTLKTIEKTFAKINLGYEFQYSFLDEKLDALYKAEQKQGLIFSIFSLIAIFVAALGLFGLASFMAKYRTKEIGVRKVNGATIQTILTTLNIDFIKWIAIAYALACPISWLIMNQWLKSFTYKTEFSWWIYLVAGTIAGIVAVITVSFQSYRAAIKDPVEALRYE